MNPDAPHIKPTTTTSATKPNKPEEKLVCSNTASSNNSLVDNVVDEVPNGVSDKESSIDPTILQQHQDILLHQHPTEMR